MTQYTQNLLDTTAHGDFEDSSGFGEKSKKEVLNMDARKAPGKKIAPRREMVFMAAESRFALCASLRCSPAIWKLSFDSFCAMMLYNCNLVSNML